MADFTDIIGATLANTRTMDAEVRACVAEYLRYSMGYPDMSPDDYRDMLAREGDYALAWEVAPIVSDTVRSMVVERLAGQDGVVAGDTVGLLIVSLFQFDDRVRWAAIAHGFLPESAEDYALEVGVPFE